MNKIRQGQSGHLKKKKVQVNPIKTIEKSIIKEVNTQIPHVSEKSKIDILSDNLLKLTKKVDDIERTIRNYGIYR